jgi:hypothetical protein
MVRILRLTSVIAVAAALFTACAGQNNPSSGGVTPLVDLARVATKQSAGSAALNAAKKVPATVYVGNIVSEPDSYVTAFNGSGSKTLRTIPSSYRVIGLTVDVHGHLFVATEPSGNGTSTLSIYGNRGSKLLQTLTENHGFYSPTLDPEGNMFTWCGEFELCEYAADGEKVVSNKIIWRLRLSKDRLNGQVVIDPSGDIAIGTRLETWVFKPGQQTPYWKINDDSYQGAIAFDSSGNLYVGSGNSCGSSGSIAMYAPNETTPTRVLSDASSGNIQSLSFDASGNLYALTSACKGVPSAIAVFPPQASAPSRTITKGLEDFTEIAGMAVAATGQVYVAGVGDTLSSGRLVVYAAGSSNPLRTVTTGAQYPFNIAAAPALAP